MFRKDIMPRKKFPATWLLARVFVVITALGLFITGVAIQPDTSNHTSASAPADSVPSARPATASAPMHTVVSTGFQPVDFRTPMTPPSGGSCMQPASGTCMTLPGHRPGEIARVQNISWQDLLAWNGVPDATRMPANKLMRLTPPDGGSVNVPASAPAPAAAPASGSVQDRIIAEAWKFVNDGADYRIGGQSRNLRDCSALVWFVLQDAGLDVPYRNSDALIAWATPISREEARAGDLVLRASTPSRYGHAAIYAGNGMVIDHGAGNNGAKHQAVHGTGNRYYRVPVSV
jgi:cell wall-associated NlpC family hydrolase